MTTDSAPRRRSHTFGPRETRGLLIGLRGSQLAVVMLGLGGLVAGLSIGGLAPIAGAGLLVLAGFAASTPLSGRTSEQWAPVVVSYLAKRALWWHAYRRPLDAKPNLPRHLDGTRVLSVPVTGGRSVGVIEDRHRGTLAATMSLGGDTFMLLGRDDQDRRASAWGALLAGLAREGSRVSRVQWVARTAPDTGVALRRFWEQAGTRTGAPAESYQQLQAGPGAQGWRTETYLTVVVDSRRGRPPERVAANENPAGTELLMRELAGVEERLGQCDLDIAGWLPPRGLAKVLRESYEPSSQSVLEARGPEGSGPGVDPAVAGPMAARESWAAYRSDDAWHATYWIHEWPRLGVGSDFLAPLLTSSGSRRTVTVIAEPVDARRAARQISSARTAEVANQAMRDRVGQLTTERNRAEAADVEQREQDLVAGHADYRFTGLLTVTAATLELLDEACAQAEISAHGCYLEIRRLYGEQDQAFAAVLPLGRGLR